MSLIRTTTAIFFLLGLLVSPGRAQLSADNTDTGIDRTALASKTHHTWEGVYSLSEVQTLKIEGQADLNLILYRCPGQEGTMVDFAVAGHDGMPRFLRETDENIKGVTPVLDGVDVFPGKNGAEIIVRWRHPGNGGHRTIEKYRYTTSGLELLDKSRFRGRGFGMKWVSDNIQ